MGFREAVSKIRKHVRWVRTKTVDDTILITLKSAQSIKKNIKPALIMEVPKTGGILPLIPIFAGLSAHGTLTGGATVVEKSVILTKSTKQQLEEAWHKKSMEAITLR